jgi:MFS family permease
VHLAIGQVYAWSVFKAPLEKYLNLSGKESALPFQLGIVMLGLSAAVLGTRVEKNGPRWAMFVSLLCFCSGFMLAALGAYTQQYWLVVLGYGGLGGIGLGVGYISPVSTLIKWFPDRPGMATGIAIMGFGGGALIASPWSAAMLGAFGVAYEKGKVLAVADDAIATTFLVHGLVYAVFMTLGVLLVRVPPEGWRPKGWSPADSKTGALITTNQVSARNAIRTPQFWCLWVVLCLNVTAGIGILEKASPMILDFFGKTSMAVTATAAAGFVALLSLANMLGRIVWSSASDIVGRKNIYRLYLGAGAIMYLVIALVGIEEKVVFIGCAIVILSFYGAGFATIPAYLRDLFGTYQVGAIHGRLLTAWSAAGVLGPLIINQIADSQKAAGYSGPALYTTSLYIMIGLLVIGFLANELVRPVKAKFHEARELGDLGKPAATAAAVTTTAKASNADETGNAAKASSAAKASNAGETASAAKPSNPGETGNRARTGNPGRTGNSFKKGNRARTGNPARTGNTGKMAIPGKTGNTGKTPIPGKTGNTGKTPTPAKTAETADAAETANTATTAKTAEAGK